MPDCAQGRNTPLCPHFHHAIELVGRRWSGAIVWVLLRGRARFAEVRAAIPEITDRMLAERLRELEREGLVERRVLPVQPVRVEYELTEKGRALAAVVDAVSEWANRWLAGVPPSGEGRQAADD